MVKRYFWSDPHFYHTNSIKYCDRPFENADEMNHALIQNHNELVDDRSESYCLGDFGFARYGLLLEIVKQLNGKKYLILGNHDKPIRKNRAAFEHYFEFIGDYLEITQQDHTLEHGKQKIIMFHYPMVTWNKAHYGSILCCGHSHGSLNHWHEQTTSLDVGVDNNNYYPFSYEQIKEIMSKKKYKTLDHHSRK